MTRARPLVTYCTLGTLSLGLGHTVHVVGTVAASHTLSAVCWASCSDGGRGIAAAVPCMVAADKCCWGVAVAAAWEE